MARTLDIYLEHALIGHLIQDDGGQIVFDYAPSWREKSAAFPISCSLPLRSERFTQRECKGFFGGILPEEGNRKLVARILAISENNDFALLERIGGECAGALTFVPQGNTPPTPDGNYRELTDEGLADILRTLPKRPLLAGEKGVRLSLAGEQDKIAVRVDADGSRRLAPLYDVVCTVFYPEIDNTLAMAIGGEANPDLVFAKEIEAFARGAGLAPAAVQRRVSGLADRVRGVIEDIDKPDATAEKIAAIIAKRCDSYISRVSKQ